jgi:hypothetical protein
MALSSATIATGISALSISGVTVKNVTAIPDQVTGRDCPILFPSPDGWLTGGNGVPGPLTFGLPASRYWEFDRDYDYVFLFAPVGTGRGLIDNISPMAAKLDLIMTAITLLDLPGVDVMQINCTAFGVLVDPSGNSFHGCHVVITLKEAINP